MIPVVRTMYRFNFSILITSTCLLVGRSFLKSTPMCIRPVARFNRYNFLRQHRIFHVPFRLRISDGDAMNSEERPYSEFDSVSTSSSDIGDEEPSQLPEIVAPEILLTDEERFALWEEINELEPQWKDALEANNSAISDMLLNRINELKATEPYFSLMESMNTAIANDEFSNAAVLKLKMGKVGVPAKLLEKVKNGSKNVDRSPTIRQAMSTALISNEAFAASEANALRTAGSVISDDGSQIVYSARSDTTTNRVRVEVRSQYYREQSNPQKHRYVFIYRVTITNNSPFTIQLVSRKWQIRTINTKTDKTEVQEVSGPGVVGQQPVLEPGQSFEYNSACPISQAPKDNIRVLGRMEGCYLMVTGSNGQHYFQAKISPFYLILPDDVML